MAFSVRKKTKEEGTHFVEKIRNGVFFKDGLTNHGKEFKGGGEESSLASFTQFIGSASYEMMKIRSEQTEKGGYLGY